MGGAVAVVFALPFAYLLIRAGEDWSAVWRRPDIVAHRRAAVADDPAHGAGLGRGDDRARRGAGVAHRADRPAGPHRCGG